MGLGDGFVGGVNHGVDVTQKGVLVAMIGDATFARDACAQDVIVAMAMMMVRVINFVSFIAPPLVGFLLLAW